MCILIYNESIIMFIDLFQFFPTNFMVIYVLKLYGYEFYGYIYMEDTFHNPHEI
jgi:hypothetical protein